MIKYSANNVLNKVFQLVKSKFDSLAKVATSGSYNDLTDKPNIGQIYKASVEITESGVSSISIPITISDANQLTVYQNGILLTQGINYTATTSAITLINYTCNVNDVFTFIGSSLTGQNVSPSAASVTIVDADANFTGVTSVEGALKYIADNWRPSVKSISLNSSKISPDSNGNVNITISIPIKSLSVYGSEVTPDSSGNININGLIKSLSVYGTSVTKDTSGNVNITGLIKSLSLNGTSYAPNSSGVLTLTNIMKTDTQQTMQNKLIAQSNTDYTTKQVRNIILSTSEPTSSDGADGDVWIMYSE